MMLFEEAVPIYEWKRVTRYFLQMEKKDRRLLFAGQGVRVAIQKKQVLKCFFFRFSHKWKDRFLYCFLVERDFLLWIVSWLHVISLMKVKKYISPASRCHTNDNLFLFFFANNGLLHALPTFFSSFFFNLIILFYFWLVDKESYGLQIWSIDQSRFIGQDQNKENKFLNN